MPLIGIVAGEASGDLLGSHLVRALKARRPDLEFVGIAGPKMEALGVSSLYPMERLAVRGYAEVLRHLPGLLKMRRQLAATLIARKPDIFIGVDAPDFNLGLERTLKKQGIPTVHYVSPSIWAWRAGRMSKIKKAVSHVLALFPFEVPLYTRARVPVTYVGHPLADMIPLEPDQPRARRDLRIAEDRLVIAMLPGSRQSELHYMADLFVKTAMHIHQQIPDVQLLVPLVTRETREMFEAAIFRQQAFDLPISLLFGHAHQAMEAADAVLVASGTATLEAALLKRPMVITYKMSSWSWPILKRMNYLPYVGLPNVLAGRHVVPELLQQQATPETLAETLLALVHDKEAVAEIKREFSGIHVRLAQNTAEKAADAILALLAA